MAIIYLVPLLPASSSGYRNLWQDSQSESIGLEVATLQPAGFTPVPSRLGTL